MSRPTAVARALGGSIFGSLLRNSPPSSEEVKGAWSYTSTLQYIFMAWYLIKHRHNFTLTFTLNSPFITLKYFALEIQLRVL